MNWWQGVVLGVVQGLSEFLPVSSSGHLVVAERALGVPRQGVAVEVALHVATLAAGLLVDRRRIWGVLAVAVVAALLAGVAAIKLLVRLLERGAFHRFAPYCWSLGAATLAWALRA